MNREQFIEKWISEIAGEYQSTFISDYYEMLQDELEVNNKARQEIVDKAFEGNRHEN